MVLVGAGTVRAEDYGPPEGHRRGARRCVAARGQARGAAPRRRDALASTSTPTAALFTDPANRPYVITYDGRARPIGVAALGEVAEIVTFGDDDVDLVAALAHLRPEGAGVVTCEGGPTLNGTLIAHDLIDEWALTVSPVLVAGDAGRSSRALVADPRRFELARLLEGDGELLGRWVRAR